MTDSTLAQAADRTKWFYAWMAMTCFLIAVVGFMPTYFIPLATGKFHAEPVVHIHGLILFSWVAFFCTQTWLVAKGKVLAHRTWGVLGIAIVTGMTFIVTAIVAMRVAQISAPNIPADFGLAVKKFEWVPFSGLVFIVPAFILAIVKINRPETHKRLMLLITISMLGAPIARWFLTFLAPPPDPNAPVILMANGLPAPAVPPVEVAIAPALIGDILWIVAMIYDWRTRGKVHPVYLIGGAIMLVMHVTVVQVASSDLWLGFVTSLSHLMG